MERIYLDNAATTQVAPEVIEKMSAVSRDYFGNPSSLHSFGQETRQVIDDARKFIAFFVGEIKPEEIIFTSGGSEADNLAIRGVVAGSRLQVASGKNSPKPHIVTSSIEHHAVLHTVKDLEKQGKIEATYVDPESNGIVQPEKIKAALKENTVLVSIMYVNNETGVVNPIREIGKMLEMENKEREKNGLGKIYFHTDAVQAAEFFETNPHYLKVDMLTLTAHKFHGPKGIGLLYAKLGMPLKGQISGGGHERGLRAGTENAAAIVGMSVAMELLIRERADSANIKQERDFPEFIASDDALRIKKMRDRLEKSLLEKIPNSFLNGDIKRRHPGISNISFVNAEGESILLNLDFLGIAIATGSACTSRLLEPSHVLTAMGNPPEKAHGSIRFSLSRQTTDEEIDKVIEVLPGIIERLRAMSPFK